jgi:hypothetical protein
MAQVNYFEFEAAGIPKQHKLEGEFDHPVYGPISFRAHFDDTWGYSTLDPAEKGVLCVDNLSIIYTRDENGPSSFSRWEDGEYDEHLSEYVEQTANKEIDSYYQYETEMADGYY